MDQRPKIMLVGKGIGGLGFSFAPLNKLLRHTPNQDTWLDTKVVCSKPCHGMNLISTDTEDYLYNPCTGYRHVYLTRETFIGSKNVGLGFNLLMQDHVIVKFLYRWKDFKSREYSLTCAVTTCGLGCAQSHFHPPLPVSDMPPTYLEGVLYWMSEPRLGPSYERAIVSFDIATNVFDVIPCPSCISVWNGSPCLAFVAELEGMLCAILANPVAEELDIWKLGNGEWDQAYKVYLKGWPGYSLVRNVVVPLAVDPKDGKILLSTGRKIGLYDPTRHFIESLYDIDNVLHVRSRESCSLFGAKCKHSLEMTHMTKPLLKQHKVFKEPSPDLSGKNSARSRAMQYLEEINPSYPDILPLVPMLYKESLASYPRVRITRCLER